MKTSLIVASAFVYLPASGWSDTVVDGTFTNFIRQTQLPSVVEWDASVSVASNGSRQSPLPIDPGGARFELWTVREDPLTSYLLDSKYVGAYVPIAELTISTGDPYAAIARTRADQPFTVEIEISGLSNDPSERDAARMVQLLRHVQSYGANGDGVNLDRTQATLESQAMLTANGSRTLNYTLTAVPGTNLAKRRGEERFSVFSLEDSVGTTYYVPASQLSAQFVQIWPVADGSISGIEEGDVMRFNTPTITITLNDLYPESGTYAHVYQGPPALGTEGRLIDGSAIVLSDTVPQDRVMVLSEWDKAIDASGEWTMELLTETPFGIDRLDYVTFTINRDISVNGAVTTVE